MKRKLIKNGRLNARKYKFLFATGGILTALIPTAAVIACGDESTPVALPIAKQLESEKAVVSNLHSKGVSVVPRSLSGEFTPEVAMSFGITNFQPKSTIFTYSYVLTPARPTGAAQTVNFNLIITVTAKADTAVSAASAAIAVPVTTSIAKVFNEQERINHLVPGRLTVSAAIVPANNVPLTSVADLLNKLAITSTLDLTQFIYTYSHGGTTKNGVLSVEIKVALKTEPSIVGTPVPLQVNVTGIPSVQQNTDSAEQQAVNQEQIRINALSGTLSTTSVIPAATHAPLVDAAALRTVLGISSTLDTTHFSYAYSHAGINGDGPLMVQIMVSSKTSPSISGTPTNLRIAVSGISTALQQIVNAEQTRVNAITGGALLTATAIPAATNEPISDAHDLEKKLGIIYNALDTSKFIYTYTHAGTNHNGILLAKIKVAMKVNPSIVGVPSDIRIGVTGIGDASITAKQQAVNAEQTRINQLSAGRLTASAAIAPVKNAPIADAHALLSTLGITITTLDTTHFSYTYSHGGIDQDNTLTVRITVADKNEATIVGTPTDLHVAVTGINAALQTGVNAEQTRINHLANGHLTATAAIAPATTKVVITDAHDLLVKLGITATLDTTKFVYSYTHAGIIADGSLAVKILVASKVVSTLVGTPTDLHVAVTGINAALQTGVNAEQTRINHLANGHLTATAAIAPATTKVVITDAHDLLVKLGITATLDTTKFVYSYTHAGIIADGSLAVKILVASKVVSTLVGTPTDLHVTVTGINIALQAAVNAEQTRVNGFHGSLTVTGPIAATANSPIADDAALVSILGITGVTLNTNQFVYTYTHAIINADGTLLVRIRVASKAAPTVIIGTPTDIRISVSGINAGLQALVNAEQTRINRLTGTLATPVAIAAATNAPIVSVAELASKLGISSTLDTTQFTYTYTHTGISHNGTLTVRIKVTSKINSAIVGTPTDISISVSGIGDTALSSVLQAVNLEQTRVNKFTGSLTATAPIAAATAVAITDNAFLTAHLGIVNPNLDTTHFTYTYTHAGISADGSLAVRITVTSKATTTIVGTPADIRISVSGIDAAIRSEQLLVNAEQTRVNKFAGSLTATAPIAAATAVAITDNAFLTAHLGIANPNLDTTHFTYAYTHAGISADGSLAVRITVTSKARSTIIGTPTAISIGVTGINAALGGSALSAEQTRVNKFTGSLTVTAPIAAATAVAITDNAFLTAHLGIVNPNLDTTHFTYTYTHAAISADGPLSVMITVTSKALSISGTPTAISIGVTGINTGLQRTVTGEQTRVNAFHGTLSAAAPIAPVTSVAIESSAALLTYLGIAAGNLDTEHYSYTYSHGGITANGRLLVKITVSSKIRTDIVGTPSNINIDVSGINEGLQALVNAEQDRVNLFSAGTLVAADTIPRAADASLADASDLLAKLGITATLDTAKFVYTYSHGEIDHDGTFPVLIKVALKANAHIVGTPGDLNFGVTGVNAGQVRLEQTRINGLTNGLFLMQSASRLDAAHGEVLANPQDLLDKFGLSYAIDTSKFTYTYSYPAISSLRFNSKLSLTIVVTLNADTSNPKITSNATPITIPIAFRVSQSEVNAERQRILSSMTGKSPADYSVIAIGTLESLLNYYSHPLSGFHLITANDAATIGIQSLLSNSNSPSGGIDFQKFSYEVSRPAITDDGTIDVTVTVRDAREDIAASPLVVQVAVLGVRALKRAWLASVLSTINFSSLVSSAFALVSLSKSTIFAPNPATDLTNAWTRLGVAFDISKLPFNLSELHFPISITKSSGSKTVTYELSDSLNGAHDVSPVRVDVEFNVFGISHDRVIFIDGLKYISDRRINSDFFAAIEAAAGTDAAQLAALKRLLARYYETGTNPYESAVIEHIVIDNSHWNYATGQFVLTFDKVVGSSRQSIRLVTQNIFNVHPIHDQVLSFYQRPLSATNFFFAAATAANLWAQSSHPKESQIALQIFPGSFERVVESTRGLRESPADITTSLPISSFANTHFFGVNGFAYAASAGGHFFLQRTSFSGLSLKRINVFYGDTYSGIAQKYAESTITAALSLAPTSPFAFLGMAGKLLLINNGYGYDGSLGAQFQTLNEWALTSNTEVVEKIVAGIGGAIIVVTNLGLYYLDAISDPHHAPSLIPLSLHAGSSQIAHVSQITASLDGRYVYFSIPNTGIYQFDIIHKTFRLLSGIASGVAVSKLVPGNAGSLYVIAGNQLYKLENEHSSSLQLVNSFWQTGANPIAVMQHPQTGVLYVATDHDGVHTLTPDGHSAKIDISFGNLANVELFETSLGLVGLISNNGLFWW